MKKLFLPFSIVFTSLLSAQIYSPAGNIGSTTNPSTNYVGIGTSIPKAKLDVHDSGPIGSNQLNLSTSHLKNSERYFMKNTVLGTGKEDVTFSLRHDGQMYVNGNVGIGNTNPKAKLNVQDSGPAGSNQFELSTYHLRNPDRYFMKNTVLGTGQEDVTFSLRHDGQMYVNGNVGIGTTTPQEKLDVRGSFRAGTEDRFFIYNGAADVLLKDIYRGSGGRAIVHDSNNRLTLNYENDFTGGTQLGQSFLVKGTNAILDGKFEAKEVKVTLTPTADFVFEENYNLPTLQDVEKHIKEKKHLPEIASAQTMEKEGVNVGEFQIKLLQKIEELTLYSIEQQKRIEALEKKLSK